MSMILRSPVLDEEQQPITMAPAAPQGMAPVTVQHPMHAMVAPIIGKPEAPPEIGQDQMPPEMAGSPNLPATKQPKVRTMSPMERYEDHLVTKQMSDYAKDENPYGSANNHPGVFGKIMHGLSVATGGPNRRLFSENQREKQIENTEKNIGQQALQSAQTEGAQQQGDLHEQQARAAELTPTTEEESDALGVPVGTMLNAASRAALAKQSGINTQRTNANQLTNATRLSVADLQKAAREAAAAGKPQPHVITMQGGKPHVMERDPATKEYSIDRGEAPPNYAMLGGTFRLAPAMLDTANNNAPVIMNVDQLNEANATQPGRYIPAGVSAPALGKTALIEDIRGNIGHVRGILQNQNLPPFSAGQRAKIALTMGRGDKGAIDAMMTGEFMDSLNPEQQDYVIGLSQLIENAMAMRSVLGAGQGSEDLRDAIRRTIPTAANPNAQYSLKQLDQFEAVLNRLERGIPNVPLRGGGQGPGGQGAEPKKGDKKNGFTFDGTGWTK